MSKLKLAPNPSGTGTVTLQAPNTDGNFTVNFPAADGSFLTQATYTATVTGSSGTTDWTGTDPVTASVTVSGLLSTDKPFVDIDLSAVAFANVADAQTAWGTVYRVEASADNTLKLYATEEPAPSFALNITVFR